MQNNVEHLVLTPFFWQLPSKMALIDQELNIVDMTQDWSDYFNSTEETKPKTDYLHFFNGKRATIEAAIKKCLTEKKELKIGDIGLKHTDQRVCLTIKPYFNDLNSDDSWAIVKIDPTTKTNDDKLENAQLRHTIKLIADQKQIGTWLFNPDTQKVNFSKITAEILALYGSRSIHINKFVERFKLGFNQNKLSMLFFDSLAKGEPFSEKFELATGNGNPKWVFLRGGSFQNGLTGTLRDITAQVEKENRFNEKEKFVDTLINNVPTAIHLKNRSHQRILVNKAEWQLYGLDGKEEILGKGDVELQAFGNAQIAHNDEIQVFKSKRPIINKQEKIIAKNGKVTHLLTSKIPLADSKGDIRSILGIGTDITKLMEKEEDLKKLINITAAQNKKLKSFAHIVSHNLRLHSANFQMLLDFYAKEKDEKELERIMAMLGSTSEKLAETLTDLNKVVTLNNKINLKLKPTQLYPRLEKVLEDLNPLILENGVVVVNKVPKNIWAKTIHDYFDHIITNFITNAVTYRHPERKCRIVLQVSILNGRTYLDVIDNGIGIDLDKHGSKVFGMYKTFHDRPNAKGIGLFVNKNQAEAMNCTLHVESNVNKGSKFSICFYE